MRILTITMEGKEKTGGDGKKKKRTRERGRNGSRMRRKLG